MEKRWIKNLQAGQTVSEVYLVIERDLRQARNGSHYIHLVLGDRSGRVNARLWDAGRGDFEAMGRSDFLRVRGRVESYKSQLQLIVTGYGSVPPGEADPRQFLPAGPKDPKVLGEELRALWDPRKGTPLGRLVFSFLDDPEFEQAFLRCPAAVRLHHAYLGGLCEHTLSVSRAALALADLYPEVDADLLLAGAFFHDIGKLSELEYQTRFDYSDRGYLQGHLVLGARMVSERIDALGGFDPTLADRLLHLILSHHGQYEYGSPVLPMTLEAILLHYADNIDAKAKMFGDAAEKAREEGSTWTAWIRPLERRLYAGPAAAEPGGEDAS
jgi:3'-5' exoribonuclease